MWNSIQKIKDLFKRPRKGNTTDPSSIMPNTSDDPPPPYSSIITPVTKIEGDAPEPDLTLETSIGVVGKNPNAHNIMVRIQPTHGIKRTPANICCVVDISGSMDDEATFMNDTGSRESDGLTILDIVKHAIKTVLSTMNEQDTLSIISFSDTGRVELLPTSMDSPGKASAFKIIESLHTEGSTNLWGGLELGLDTIRTNTNNTLNKIQSIFLFTDGMPNVNPPRGHIPMIKLYKEKYNNELPCIVNTFGFGYSLDSILLDEIARECNGNYVFIPDSGFVGTAFINATANLYTVMAENVTMRVLINSDVIQTKEDIEILGGHQILDCTWGKIIHVGNIHYDQSKEFIITLKHEGIKNWKPIKNKEYFTVYLDYKISATDKVITKESIVTGSNPGWEEEDVSTNNNILKHTYRSCFVDTIDQTIKSMMVEPSSSIQKNLKTIKNSVHSIPNDDEFIPGLLQDINGQVTEGLLNLSEYSRWGKHYLLSLADAHRSQICNNFKDPGVQGYGGPLFCALRNNFDEIFNHLPPPKPTGRRPGTRNGPINMCHYNNSRGICFHGDCIVQMGHGTEKKTKKIRDICKNDYIMTMDGQESKVLCVVKTIIDDEDEINLVEFPGGLLITSYHPVYDNYMKMWRFPIDMYASNVVSSCDAVFNFVLEKHHSMIINGVGCVTLGHGAMEDIREHPYFGTDLVVKDLMLSGGWEDGFVICKNILRDHVTKLVCGMELTRPGIGVSEKLKYNKCLDSDFLEESNSTVVLAKENRMKTVVSFG